MNSPDQLVIDYIQEKFTKKRKSLLTLFAILKAMAKHNLDATKIVDLEGSLDVISILWQDGFNATHKVLLMCPNNDGQVIGQATDSADPTWEKMWIVSDLSPEGNEGVLRLTLDETLEYVRHFIWANHNV
jgi:hypothetical protein